MDISEYIAKMRTIYNAFLKFIEDDDNIEENYHILYSTIINEKACDDKHTLKQILLIINKVSNNHNRTIDFFDKIRQVVSILKEKIIKYFSNIEIFDIFKNNKKILLILKEEQILIINKIIVAQMKKEKYKKLYYLHFFFPEIKQFLCKSVLTRLSSEIPENLEEKRNIGENDNYICELIRNDSIEDFIIYVDKTLLSLNSTIKSSIFETNSFLSNKNPTLIEYSAFFGSIQIFKYLYKNDALISSYLWIYAVHGSNPEIINLLEEKKIEPAEGCLEEAIKCHHNDIANYLLENILDNEKEKHNLENNFDSNITAYCFHYNNYAFFPNDLDNKFIFHYACEYDHFYIVEHFIKNKKIDINATVVFFLFNFYEIFYFLN